MNYLIYTLQQMTLLQVSALLTNCIMPHLLRTYILPTILSDTYRLNIPLFQLLLAIPHISALAMII